MFQLQKLNSKPLWLDVAGHMISFNQSECIISQAISNSIVNKIGPILLSAKLVKLIS